MKDDTTAPAPYTLGALIAALNIFNKHAKDDIFPTSCEHNTLYVLINPNRVPPEDIKTLEGLGFFADSNLGSFVSTMWG